MNSAGDKDDEPGLEPPPGAAARQRLDKWLWFARVARSRTLAATLITEGKVRINGERIDKPATPVRVGEVVTVLMRQQVRILRIKAFAVRRGSAVVASALFEELTPRPEPGTEPSRPAKDGHREPGSGRPTKRERREIDRFKSRST